ncbi:MAG TPA: THxN family PEP-CTERM protein [Pedomonas sp.]|uniref:THxN family PEP-CTERM protein n=1 Tax=Pedomonas sp. TaxID=2976421 RepID=UPI002F4167DE
MSKLKSIVSAVAFGTVVSAASLANAALITEWSFNVTNTWNQGATTWEGSGSNPSNAFRSNQNRLPNNQDPAASYNLIQWGSGSTKSFLAADSSYTQSSLKTDDVNGARGASYYHGNYEVTGKTLASTQLQTSITINSVNPAGTTIPITRTFDIEFRETPNDETRWVWIIPGVWGYNDTADIATANCEGYAQWGSQATGNIKSCPDRFALDTSALSFTQEIDDYLYTFTVAFDRLSNVLAVTENGDNTNIWTRENTMSTLTSSIYVTAQQILPPPSEVPEPGTVALLGLGLAGVGFGMRRRRK